MARWEISCLQCSTCLEYLTLKVSRRHPNQMPEPPQPAPFNVEKWQIYSGFSRMAEHLTLLLRESPVILWRRLGSAILNFRSQPKAHDHTPPWLKVGTPSFSGWRPQSQTVQILIPTAPVRAGYHNLIKPTGAHHLSKAEMRLKWVMQELFNYISQVRVPTVSTSQWEL